MSKAVDFHRKYHGKIETGIKVPVTAETLPLIYTPGVAEVSEVIARGEDGKVLTSRGNTIAIVSDGSAVLGLGNIGPDGALPVMEGKAVLFKTMAGVDAVPLCV